MIVQEATSVISSASDLVALEDEWNALLDDSGQSSFNMRPLWLVAWWRHFAPPEARLEVVACRDAGGTLIGLAPLYFDPLALEVRFIGVGREPRMPTNLAAAILARRGEERAVVEAVDDAMKGRRLWLARMRPELETVRLLRGRLEPNPEPNLFVSTRGDWEGYRTTLGHAGRKRIQRYARRAAERGCLFRRVAMAGELERAFALYLRWHHDLLGDGVYALPEHAAFLRAVVMKGFAEGRVRVWIAELDGAIVAVDIAFVDAGAVTDFQGHADPSHSSMRLGHVMTAHLLHDCFDDPGVDSVVLGKAAPHKLHWAKTAWGTVDLRREG